MKFLHLKFEGARLIRTHRATKDVFVDYSLDNKEKRRPRTLVDDPNFSAPMNVNHISNMLHVLLGERPIPSRRVTKMVVVPGIFELANKSYVKIDDIRRYVTSKDTYEPLTEVFSSRKSLWNSFSTSVEPTWELMRYQFKSSYTDLIDYIESIHRGISEIPLVESLDILDGKLDDTQLKYLDKNFKLFFYAITKQKGLLSSGHRKITFLRGVDKSEIYNGEIIIPIDDGMLDKLSSGSGCATLLDGGLVTIIGLKEDHEIDIDLMGEFKLLSELYEN